MRVCVFHVWHVYCALYEKVGEGGECSKTVIRFNDLLGTKVIEERANHVAAKRTKKTIYI